MSTTHEKSNTLSAGVKIEICEDCCKGNILSLAEARERLIELGWTYRDAALALGLKRYQSLYKILNGQYQNKRVLRAIATLEPSARRRYERRHN